MQSPPVSDPHPPLPEVTEFGLFCQFSWENKKKNLVNPLFLEKSYTGNAFRNFLGGWGWRPEIGGRADLHMVMGAITSFSTRKDPEGKNAKGKNF